MAADVLSQAGHRVAIYERMRSPARKFLMAGRGGLNITHSEPLDSFLTKYRAGAKWLEPAIGKFSPADMQAFCHSLGQDVFTGSSGRVFPKSFKASPLLRAWLRKLGAAGVELHLQHSFCGWNDKGAALFKSPDGEINATSADALILAMGGASWPKLGSDAAWTGTLAKRGIAINPFVPANCGFVADWPAHIGERYAGSPLKPIALQFAGRRYVGECIITASGLEGGVIYAASAEMRDAIAGYGEAIIQLDLKPNVPATKLAERLAATPHKQSLSNRLRKGPRLRAPAIALIRMNDPPQEPEALARLIKACPVRLIAPQPVARAISSAGGISLDNLDTNLMVKAMPGVFAAGEMLDWEAPTGGYLLQACFATGAAAARGAMRWLEEQERLSGRNG